MIWDASWEKSSTLSCFSVYRVSILSQLSCPLAFDATLRCPESERLLPEDDLTASVVERSVWHVARTSSHILIQSYSSYVKNLFAGRFVQYIIHFSLCFPLKQGIPYTLCEPNYHRREAFLHLFKPLQAYCTFPLLWPFHLNMLLNSANQIVTEGQLLPSAVSSDSLLGTFLIFRDLFIFHEPC